MILEVITISTIAMIGFTAVFAMGLRGWGILPIGLVVGVSLMILFGMLQLATGLPTTPRVPLTLFLLSMIAYWIFYIYINREKLELKSYILILGTPAATLALTLLIYIVFFPYITTRHVDVIEYLSIGSLLQSDRFEEYVSMYQLQKRLVAVPLMHSAANLIGNMYLTAITPLLALATIGASVWLWIKGASLLKIKNKHVLISIVLLGVLLFATNSNFVMHATYINGHLFAGLLVLLITGLGWLASIEGKKSSTARTYVAIISILMPVLVLTRPEGFIMAFLILVPVMISKNFSHSTKSILLSSLGISMIVWHVFLVYMYSVIRGAELSSISSSIYLPIVLGIGTLIAIPVINTNMFKKYANKIPLTIEAGMWLLLAALSVIKPELIIKSINSTLVNVSPLESSWGISWVVLFVLVIFVMLFRQFKNDILLRFPVTTFIPMVSLLVYMRGGAYRVGQSDSLDRMWMQIIPLVIVYIIAAILYSYNKPIKDKELKKKLKTT